MTSKLARVAACSVIILASGAAIAADMGKKGVTPYVTHFIFRPVQNLDISGLGTATLLEAVGTTENLKGEKMLDKMWARAAWRSVSPPARRNISTVPACSPMPTATRFSPRHARSRQVAARHELRHAYHHRGHRQVYGDHRQRAVRLQRIAGTGRRRRLHGHGHTAQHRLGDQVTSISKPIAASKPSLTAGLRFFRLGVVAEPCTEARTQLSATR